MSYPKNYGLSKIDLEVVRTKIKRQKNYLESNKFFSPTTGQEISLLDVSYSANHSSRYYARVLNKVDTFVSYNLSLDYVPLFLTCTLDGFFRDFLKGDYSRFTDKKREFYLQHIPNNSQNGKILDAIDNKEVLTNKDLYKVLSHQFNRFTQSYALRKIKKDNHTYSYIKAIEPHKNGVPHFHILMYIPKEYLSTVYTHFHNCFPAPRNSQPLTFKDNGRLSDIIVDDKKETQGFQTAINTSAGYILKYILKSFVDVKKGKEIDYLQAWYTHNRIPRLITSQTLVPQDIYHKVSLLEKDWHYLTDVKHTGTYKRDIDKDTFSLEDNFSRKIVGDNGLYLIFNQGRLIKKMGSKVYKAPMIRLKALIWSAVKPFSFNVLNTYRIYRGIKYNYVRKSNTIEYVKVSTTLKRIVPVVRMSDQSLFNLYHNFDFDLMHPAKFCLVKNQMIYRGFLQERLANINDYNTNFDSSMFEGLLC